jgi:hypothetical protein
MGAQSKVFGGDRMNSKASKQGIQEKPELSKITEILIDECRMILPGIQTLFGFQLIAVFNSTFDQKLSSLEQRLHLLAIVLIGIAIVLIMTPPAFHRQIGPQHVTEQFIRLTTRLLLISMVPLALSIGLDLYLISRLILNNVFGSLLISLGLLILFFLSWFVLPRSEALKQMLGGKP